MGLPSRSLGADEYVVLHTRTHAKALVLPALGLIVVGALVGAGAAAVPSGYRRAGQAVVVGLGLLLALWWAVRPFLRWWTTTYSLTNRRLVMRSGVLSRTSVDLPLWRINDLTTQRSLLDRLLGCGTLVAQTAGESGTVALQDVPEVEHVQQAVAELLFGDGAPGPAAAEETERSWPGGPPAYGRR